MKLLFFVEVDSKIVKIFFNRQYYWVDTKFEDISQPIVPISELKVKTFKTINEAKDYLVNDLKVDRKKIPNFTAIINRGKELGIEIKFETE